MMRLVLTHFKFTASLCCDNYYSHHRTHNHIWERMVLWILGLCWAFPSSCFFLETYSNLCNSHRNLYVNVAGVLLKLLAIINNKVIALGQIQDFSGYKKRHKCLLGTAIQFDAHKDLCSTPSNAISPKICSYQKNLSKGNLSSNTSLEQGKPRSMKCLLSCTLAKSRVHHIAFRSQVIYTTYAYPLQNSLVVREFIWKLRDLFGLG